MSTLHHSVHHKVAVLSQKYIISLQRCTMDGLHHFEAALHHICTFTYLAEGFFFFFNQSAMLELVYCNS